MHIAVLGHADRADGRERAEIEGLDRLQQFFAGGQTVPIAKQLGPVAEPGRDQCLDRLAWSHVNRKLLQFIPVRSFEAHRVVQGSKRLFEIILRFDQRELCIRDFHQHQVQIDLRFELMLVQRLHLITDGLPLLDRLSRNRD